MSKKTYKPGEIVQDSGQAKIVGPRGGKTNHSEITLVEGKRVPPTPKPNQKVVLTDKTKHKK